MKDFSKPQAVTGLDVTFGGKMQDLLPPYDSIPKEFKGNHPWCTWQREWFYNGLKNGFPKPKEGIDVGQAMAHLKAIQCSFDPSHEHKEAGVAYLASLWFKEEKKLPPHSTT